MNEQPLESVTDPDELRSLVVFLYGLLDWVDTADDMAKSDDKHYRSLCQSYQRKRHERITSDGNNLLVKLSRSTGKPCGFWSRFAWVTKSDLEQQIDKVMGKIADFVSAQNAQIAEIDASISGIATDITGLKADVDALKKKLEEYELDESEIALLEGVATKTADIAAKVKALDEATPPPAPPAQ